MFTGETLYSLANEGGHNCKGLNWFGYDHSLSSLSVPEGLVLTLSKAENGEFNNVKEIIKLMGPLNIPDMKDHELTSNFYN